MTISNRALVIAPFAIVLICAVLPLPQPEPRSWLVGWPSCPGCDRAVWQSYAIAGWGSVLMMLLFLATVLKLVLVLAIGELPDSILFRWIVPVLWVIFFALAAYSGASAVQQGIVWTAYDSVSLIPFIGFAAVDFTFVWKIRRRRLRFAGTERRFMPGTR
ncbi:MAG TPA: hypothetical protein VMT81_01765 [Candidatus Paceibacterota bacterium]|nr:hypothetical protein [Candidatus Paceibacterota bacterium]